MGWLGSSLIADLPRVRGLELAAVQDANVELARGIGARYRIPYAADPDALLRMDVDAVVISTPNALHAPQTRAALEAGKDVLVQKPLATTAADARALVALAEGAGRVLFVDHTYRFLRTTSAFRSAFADVRPDGPIRAVFHNIYGPGRAWSRDPALAGGGAFMDLGVHLVDLVLLLVRPRAARLVEWAVGWTRGHPVEDEAMVALDLDGRSARIDVSWEAALGATEIAVRCGTGDREVAWENVDGSFFRFRARRGDAVLLDEETTLRVDTLREFARALETRTAPAIDLRVHELIDEYYSGAGRAGQRAAMRPDP